MLLPFVVTLPIEIALTTEYAAQLSFVVINTSGICLFTSVVVVSANLIEHLLSGEENTALALCSMYLFFAALITFALLAATGAIKRKPLLLMISFVVLLILFIFWLGLCSVLYSSWHIVGDLCVNDRCPENLWMSDFYNNSIREVTSKFKKNKTVKKEVVKELYHFDKVDNLKSDTKPEYERSIVFLLLSLVIFFSFLFFFTMLGSMVLNYYNTLIQMQDLNTSDDSDAPGTFPHAVLVFVYPLRQILERSSSPRPTGNESERKPESAKKPESSAGSETAKK